MIVGMVDHDRSQTSKKIRPSITSIARPLPSPLPREIAVAIIQSTVHPHNYRPGKSKSKTKVGVLPSSIHLLLHLALCLLKSALGLALNLARSASSLALQLLCLALRLAGDLLGFTLRLASDLVGFALCLAG